MKFDVKAQEINQKKTARPYKPFENKKQFNFYQSLKRKRKKNEKTETEGRGETGEQIQS